ncbi:MAG: hypothetical protein LUF82_03885 [Clostridia bacterium]|nr:hypothetical protein [Clostridia bacterium]
MTEKKAKIIRLVYNIIFSLLTFTLAVLFIYEVCDIYFGSGGGVFTRAVVTERLGDISVCIWLWVAAIIIGLVLYEVFPPQGKKKYGQDVRYSLYRLKKKLPVKAEGDLLGDAAAVAKYERILKIVWGVAAAGCVIFAAVGLAYLLDFSHFRGDDVTEDVKTAIIKICPYVVCAFALCIGAAIYQGYGAKKKLPHIKRLVALGKKDNPQYNRLERAYYAAVAAVESDKYIWTVRAVLFVVAVVFIILGILNDGAGDVLLKAVNICTECIGLG